MKTVPFASQPEKPFQQPSPPTGPTEQPGQPAQQPIHAPVDPDPKAHPIHPEIPMQPIHEGTDPTRPITGDDLRAR
jgi:hypothetical protein